jgi:hypothetical protein
MALLALSDQSRLISFQAWRAASSLDLHCEAIGQLAVLIKVRAFCLRRSVGSAVEHGSEGAFIWIVPLTVLRLRDLAYTSANCCINRTIDYLSDIATAI